jgi:hypothetical protein
VFNGCGEIFFKSGALKPKKKAPPERGLYGLKRQVVDYRFIRIASSSISSAVVMIFDDAE